MNEAVIIKWLAAFGAVVIAALVVFGGEKASDVDWGDWLVGAPTCDNHHWGECELKRIGVVRMYGSPTNPSPRYTVKVECERECLHDGCRATETEIMSNYPVRGFEDGLERAKEHVEDE